MMPVYYWNTVYYTKDVLYINNKSKCVILVGYCIYKYSDSLDMEDSAVCESVVVTGVIAHYASKTDRSLFITRSSSILRLCYNIFKICGLIPLFTILTGMPFAVVGWSNKINRRKHNLRNQLKCQ